MKAKELLKSYAAGLRNFSEVELTSLSLIGARLCHINLEAATLADADLVKVDFFNARLSKVRLARANLNEADLGEADLREANLKGANLRGANLRGATLINTDLRQADLTDANLTNANLKSASLIKAKLIRTDLTNADLDRANLAYAVVSSVKLKNTTLYGATMPNGKVFSPPSLGINDDNNLNKQSHLRLTTSDLLQLEACIQEAVAIVYWNITRDEKTNSETIKNIVIEQINRYINFKLSLFNSLEQ